MFVRAGSPAATFPGVNPRLELPNGESVDFVDGLTIGRVKPAEVVVTDDKVSRRHAKLILEGGVAEIEDLGSRNGTSVNGNQITKRLLRDGDEIRVGGSVLVYREAVVADVAPSAAEPDELDFDEIGFEDEVSEASPAPVAPAPAPTPDVEVLEFEDEVVEVQKPAASTAASAAAAARAAGSAQPRRADPRTPLHQRTSSGDSGGVFGQDVSQLGGTPRMLMTLLAVAIAGGVGYLAFTFAN